MRDHSEIHSLLEKTLATGVQYLGIPRCATEILALLYLEEHENRRALSIREINERTSLSLSSVSVLCSRLRDEGILNEQSDASAARPGRRRLLYQINMTIDELLTLGIRKYLMEVAHVYREIEACQRVLVDDQEPLKRLLRRLEREVRLFQVNNSRLVARDVSLRISDKSEHGLELGGSSNGNTP